MNSGTQPVLDISSTGWASMNSSGKLSATAASKLGNRVRLATGLLFIVRFIIRTCITSRIDVAINRCRLALIFFGH